jgi:hypothetical protein
MEESAALDLLTLLVSLDLLVLMGLLMKREISLSRSLLLALEH